MALLNLSVAQKLLVIGPIWQSQKLSRLSEMLLEYDWIVINGGLSYPVEDTLYKIETISNLMQSGKVVYNLDDTDLSFISRIDISNSDHLYIERWLKMKPNVVVANFPNTFRINIVNGGIPSSLTHGQLADNLEVSFVSDDWHDKYSGGLGYVISNYPLTTWAPKFHRYSVQMGNIVNPKSQVYAFKIDQYGIRRTIIL